jgi:cobalt-zinc-cadmium efflux system protein
MQRVLRLALALTLAYVLLTLVAGLRVHSLALLSEAGHNASDFLALLLSFLAVHLQARPASETKTYGYHRAEVLAAFVNALALIVIAVWVSIAAVGRLLHPVPVGPRTMMAVAAVGVAINGVLAWMLARVRSDLNMRGAFLHMLGDTLSTAAVIVGGAIIQFTGRLWVDPALSLLISALIFWSSLDIVRETLNILLEGTPKGMQLSEVRRAMEEVDGVCNVHDLHIWSLGANLHALSCHVIISDIPPSESGRILDELGQKLRARFSILHTTIQFEDCEKAGCPLSQGCLRSTVEDAHTSGHAALHT